MDKRPLNQVLLDEFNDQESPLRHVRLDAVLSLYTYFGIALAVIGGLLFLLVSLEIRFSTAQLIGFVGFATGTLMAVLAQLFLRSRRLVMVSRTSGRDSIRDAAEFLYGWARFEHQAREQLLREADSFNRYSIKEAIRLLANKKRISPSDVMFLERALQMRNRILHEDESFPPSLLAMYSERLEEMVASLQDAPTGS